MQSAGEGKPLKRFCPRAREEGALGSACDPVLSDEK